MAPTFRRGTGVSEKGERLLGAARDRTGWHGKEASERQEQLLTRFYDQRGNDIRDESHLEAVLDDADDVVRLVPAMAPTESPGWGAADRRGSSVPTMQELDRQTCGRTTDHRFETHESVPDEAWTGRPIRECRTCGAARYGPGSNRDGAGRRSIDSPVGRSESRQSTRFRRTGQLRVGSPLVRGPISRRNARFSPTLDEMTGRARGIVRISMPPGSIVTPGWRIGRSVKYRCRRDELVYPRCGAPHRPGDSVGLKCGTL